MERCIYGKDGFKSEGAISDDSGEDDMTELVISVESWGQCDGDGVVGKG